MKRTDEDKIKQDFEKRKQEYLKDKAEGKTEKYPSEKAEIRYTDASGSEKKAELEYWYEGSPHYTENFMKINIGDNEYTASSNEPYNIQLEDIRKQLEKENILLRCNGTSKRFTLTPLGISMAHGLKGIFADLETGEILEKGIDLLGFRENEEWVTVAVQKEAVDKWLKIRLKKISKKEI
jgi:hypothetical protein